MTIHEVTRSNAKLWGEVRVISWIVSVRLAAEAALCTLSLLRPFGVRVRPARYDCPPLENLAANKTHRARGGDEMGFVDVVARLFLQHHVLNVLDRFRSRCAVANHITQ